MLRTSIKLLAIASLATWSRTPAAEPPNADDAAAVSSGISEVTVYADRARIVRTAKTGLHAGLTRFAFRKLPGWIDEGSVRVSLNPPEAGELVDVQRRA